MKTVGQLKTEIRNAVWASGEPENLITAHDGLFQEAFAEISKYVIGEQEDQVSVVRFCKSYYKMGMTVIPEVPGIITRIFTIANGNYDDPVFYRQRPWPEPEGMARNLYLFPIPLIGSAPKLPIGFQVSSADNDSLYGRARTGIWAFYQKNIYLSPWTQSNEDIVIEWKGIKNEWDDLDLINEEILYKKAVKLYVQFAHERDYGKPERAVMFKNPARAGHYDEALGDLIHEDQERTKLRELTTGGYERNRLCSELSDDFPAETPDGITLADIGGFTTPSDDSLKVSNLVRSFGPNAITATGLITVLQNDYDESVGRYFHDFLNPYGGAHGIEGDTKAFWPSPAASDWTKDGAASLWTFFGLPGDLKYYDVVLGDVHLFIVDSSASDPAGINFDSVQGQWLQARLALSAAPWKIVKMERSPFGSLHSDAVLQWPFKDWGAHLVLSSQGGNYERLDVSGMAFINNGLGGSFELETVAAPSSNTRSLYADSFGAGRIVATSTELVYSFETVDGQQIDTLKLTK